MGIPCCGQHKRPIRHENFQTGKPLSVSEISGNLFRMTRPPTLAMMPASNVAGFREGTEMNYDMPHWLATLLGRTPRGLAQRDLACNVHTQVTQLNAGWSAVHGRALLSAPGSVSTDAAAHAPATDEATGPTQADLPGFSVAA